MEGNAIAPPREHVRVQAIERNIRLPSNKPLSERSIPFERGVEWLKPMNVLPRLLFPKCIDVCRRLVVERFVRCHRVKFCLARELLAGWEYSCFVQNISDSGGTVRHLHKLNMGRKKSRMLSEESNQILRQARTNVKARCQQVRHKRRLELLICRILEAQSPVLRSQLPYQVTGLPIP